MIAYPLYWLALLFGGACTVTALALGTAAALSRRERLKLGSLAAGFLVVAWLPLVALFALLYAAGARPAGGPVTNTAGPPTVLTPADASTAPSRAPGRGP